MATDSMSRFVLACQSRGLDWEISGGGPLIVAAKGATRATRRARRLPMPWRRGRGL
jgi:hypothetical protein